MVRTSFVVTVIDARTEPDPVWRIQAEARLRHMGMTVVPREECELVDVAIVQADNPHQTVSLAREIGGQTERGSLFTVWPDFRSVAVMLAVGPDEEVRATWMRSLFGNPLSKMDASALESEVISLSAIAIRDGVTTSVRVDHDGFPWQEKGSSGQERRAAWY